MGVCALLLGKYVNIEKYASKRKKRMYHGSGAKFERFEPKPHALADGDRVVFGTPLRAMAVAGIGKWTDDDFEQGTYNDEELLHMRELKPGALERVYKGKRGYLYEMDPSSFEHGGDRYMRTEFISKSSPKILKRTEVDAYEAMLAEERAGRLKIHRMQKKAAKRKKIFDPKKRMRYKNRDLTPESDRHFKVKRRGYALGKATLGMATGAALGSIAGDPAKGALYGYMAGGAGGYLYYPRTYGGEKQASAPRDYKREYRLFHSSPEAKRNRAKRNLWNRRLKGKVPAGYEIDHKRQLRDGGGNGRDNIRFMRVSKNRAEHNRSRVVRDHMRKESSIELLKRRPVEVDREKVRDHITGARKNVATTLGGGLGLLAGSKGGLGRMALASGVGAGLGYFAGKALRAKDSDVEAFINENNLDNRRNRGYTDAEMAALSAGGGIADLSARERMRKRFAKTAAKRRNKRPRIALVRGSLGGGREFI